MLPKAISQYPEKSRNVALIRIPVPSVFKIVVHWRLIELREHAVNGKMSVRSSAFEKCYVHSVQQKSIGQKFSKSRNGSDVRYSCHHNLSRFTFLIFAHSCRFSVSHSSQSITTRICEPKTTVHLLNLKLKH